MLDISFAELALVFLIALLILGPERLPKVARTLGYWAGRARHAFHHLKTELEREAFNQEMQEKFKNQLKDMGLDEDSMKMEDLDELKKLQQKDVLPPHKPLGHDDDASTDDEISTDDKTSTSHNDDTPKP